ncbi:type II toxin-antitoxin system death-on-curing family toxin [Naasia lichenicola]|uniref:Alcohol dehydrogenase n=1 Tax=Naasia lichenicola TaxID=2565933 RepID=A0A4S4FKW9_9MICO|nr:Fic family protein [Naasia lichenicola]THG30808.1 alcohol dehydrogenase [Naasia lichenicola]
MATPAPTPLHQDTPDFEYLSVDDVVQIVEIFTEAPLRESVRDMGLLIAAVDRPAIQYGGRDVYPNLADKAASLMESLARNSALFDGNKRLAWLATNVFLELNHAALHFNDNESFSLLREVSQGYISTTELAQRIAARLGPWPQPAS